MTKLYLHQKCKCSLTCRKSINVIYHIIGLLEGKKYNHPKKQKMYWIKITIQFHDLKTITKTYHRWTAWNLFNLIKPVGIYSKYHSYYGKVSGVSSKIANKSRKPTAIFSICHCTGGPGHLSNTRKIKAWRLERKKTKLSLLIADLAVNIENTKEYIREQHWNMYII